jgi:TldD protein
MCEIRTPDAAGTMDRRTFVRLTGAGGVATAVGLSPLAQVALEAQRNTAPGPDAGERDLALAALDAARSAGAVYADVRIVRALSESLATRERQITNVSKSESYGIGVRALVGGSWGFAATRNLERASVLQAGREAAAIAAANDRVAPNPLRLSPVPKVPDGRWITPHRVDPFTVSLESKAELLFRINDEALKVKGVRFVTSSVTSLKESRLLATTEGSVIQQTFIRVSPNVTVTAVAADNSDSQARSAAVGPSAMGWEYVTGLTLPERAIQYANEAVAKLSAAPVEPGVYDLVLHPSHLWLTIHESIAHPSELDRALGFEANYAGTTFLAPPEQVLGKFRLGRELMTLVANRTETGGCATVGWDDEGIAATSYPIVDKGIFVSYQSATRDMLDSVASLSALKQAPGHAFGQDWASIPFPRMPNVSLQPAARNISADEVIAATDRGIYIEGDGSYSIDQQRYNFQFGGQTFWEIRNGKKTRPLRDVAYVARTPDFWNAMAMIGGRQTYQLGGALSDAKGQPSQLNSVSHGCPIALFRGINVIRTA